MSAPIYIPRWRRKRCNGFLHRLRHSKHFAVEHAMRLEEGRNPQWKRNLPKEIADRFWSECYERKKPRSWKAYRRQQWRPHFMPIAICGVTEVPAYADANIHHIISIRDRTQPEPDLSRFAGQDIQVHRFVFYDTCTPGKDAITEDMMRDMLAVFAKIDPDQNVLFHCFAGVSRSTAAAYIYLVSKGVSYQTAYRCIQGVRGDLLAANGIQMSPNLLMIKLADRLLERKGDMLLWAARRQGAAYS